MRYDMIGLFLPFAVMLIPDLLKLESRRNAVLSTLCLLIPVLTGIGAIFAYNAVTFGSPLRTGYHFWCAFPYDFPSIVWSARNIAMNLFALNSPRIYLALIAGALGILILRNKRHPLLPAYTEFLVLGCVPAAAAHLFYAYTGTRFFILPIALLLVAGGVGTAQLIPATIQSNVWVLAAALGTLQPLLPTLYNHLQTTPTNRILVTYLRHNTPGDAVIVSGANPVYLAWYLQRNSNRIIVPISRDVGYANLLLFPHGKPHPSVMPHIGHVRTRAMLAAGGIDPVPWTAIGQPRRLLALALSGRPVYVERIEIPQDYPGASTRALFIPQPMPNLPLMMLLPRASQQTTLAR